MQQVSSSLSSEGRQAIASQDTLRKVIGRTRASLFPPEPTDLDSLVVADVFKRVRDNIFLQFDGTSPGGARVLIFATHQSLKLLADVGINEY